MKINALSKRAIIRSRGQVIVMVVIALVVLVTIVGLANDIGYAWRARLSMQSAADAGAMAAADALFMGGGVNPTSAAQSATAQNGFTNGAGTTIDSNAVTVTVNNPPGSGPNSGNSNAVEVIVAQPQPTYFLAVAGFSSLNVSARAVAMVNSSSNCMYSLSPSASGALNMSANSSVTSSCGLVINSNSSQALIGASNDTISAPSLGIVGVSHTGARCRATPPLALRSLPIRWPTCPHRHPAAAVPTGHRSAPTPPRTYRGVIIAVWM